MAFMNPVSRILDFDQFRYDKLFSIPDFFEIK